MPDGESIVGLLGVAAVAWVLLTLLQRSDLEVQAIETSPTGARTAATVYDTTAPSVDLEAHAQDLQEDFEQFGITGSL